MHRIEQIALLVGFLCFMITLVILGFKAVSLLPVELSLPIGGIYLSAVTWATCLIIRKSL